MKTILVLLGLAALAAKGDTTPMIQSFTFGRCDVIALQDKPHSMPNRLFEATAPKDVVDRLAPDGASPASMSMFIVRKDGEIALFDAGTSFATLKAGLDAIGIAPESIGAIFITHMHFDHIGGLLDGGKAAFPKASLYIAKRELAHWLKTGADAKKVADAYAGRLVEFDFGTPLPI